VDAIRKYRSEGTSCKINLALSGLPNFRALPGAPGPQHRATMHICPSLEYIERAWDDAKYGHPSQSPLLELTVPTMYDPSLAPAGKHIMGIFIQYAPYTCARALGRIARAFRVSLPRPHRRICAGLSRSDHR
jgi:phytoene dehydrogenase-like protein